MSSPSRVAEARRLADTDLGTQHWTRQLAEAVKAADDNDLGTLVVAWAVLTKAAEDRAAEVVRQEAAERVRLEAQARADAEARGQAVRTRRRTRLERLWGQLGTRLVTSAIYSVCVAFVGDTFGSRTMDGFLSWLPGVFIVCVITVAASVVFDWFAFSGGSGLPDRNPAGRLRKIAAATGIVIGLCPWALIITISEMYHQSYLLWGESLAVGPFWTPWSVAALPIALSLSWIVGGAATIAVGRESYGGSGSQPLRMIRRFGWPFAWVGAIGAVSAAAIFNILPLEMWLQSTLGSPQLLPQWNPGGLGSTLGSGYRLSQWDRGGLWAHPVWIIVFGAVALLAHEAAPRLYRRLAPLGVAVAVAGPLLGLLCLFFNPANIVTWIIDAILRIVF